MEKTKYILFTLLGLALLSPVAESADNYNQDADTTLVALAICKKEIKLLSLTLGTLGKTMVNLEKAKSLDMCSNELANLEVSFYYLADLQDKLSEKPKNRDYEQLILKITQEYKNRFIADAQEPAKAALSLCQKRVKNAMKLDPSEVKSLHECSEHLANFEVHHAHRMVDLNSDPSLTVYNERVISGHYEDLIPPITERYKNEFIQKSI